MKPSRTSNLIVFVVVLMLISGLLSPKAFAQQEALELIVGESTVLIANQLERVAVGDPAVADTVIFPNRDDQVVINAKAAGMTTLNIWDADGQRSFRIVVSRVATAMESYVYEFKNYSLTRPLYDSYTTKLVMETDKANVDNLISLLTPLLGADDFSVDPNNNRVTLRGTGSGIAAANSILDEMDQPLGQVVIEARIMDLTNDDLKQVGISLGAQRGNMSGTANFSNGNNLSVTFNTFTSLAKRFNITLDMLNELAVENTLTNPKITALDGHTAWILVGEKYPIATRDKDGMVSYTYINTGIILAIRPRIGIDGSVTLWIKPEVSSITGWVGNPNASSSNAAPIIGTSEAMSEVRVQDGEPVIIGGLKRSQNIVTRSKVPMLGSIPLAGKLFRKKRSQTQESELVIIITPHILKQEEKTVGDSSGESDPLFLSSISSLRFRTIETPAKYADMPQDK